MTAVVTVTEAVTKAVTKAFVREHYRRLPDGRLVRVSAHDANRRARSVSADEHTHSLFGENVGGSEERKGEDHPVRQEFPEECARNPEDCTVDMFSNKTRRDERLGKALILFSGDALLKATTTKTVLIPAYTKKDGTVVPAHTKIVHYNPDHEVKDIVAGGMTHSQKLAHKKLHAALPGFKNLAVDEQFIHILSSATNIQNKASQSAAVSGYKASILSGKVPSGSEIKAWGNLDPAKQMDVVSELAKKVDGGMTAVMKLHNAAVDKFGAASGVTPEVTATHGDYVKHADSVSVQIDVDKLHAAEQKIGLPHHATNGPWHAIAMLNTKGEILVVQPKGTKSKTLGGPFTSVDAAKLFAEKWVVQKAKESDADSSNGLTYTTENGNEFKVVNSGKGYWVEIGGKPVLDVNGEKAYWMHHKDAVTAGGANAEKPPAPSTPEEAAAIEADFKHHAAGLIDANWANGIHLSAVPNEAVIHVLKGVATQSGVPVEHLKAAYDAKKAAEKPAFTPDPNIHDWYEALLNGQVPSISAIAGTLHVDPKHLADAVLSLGKLQSHEKLKELMHQATVEWNKEEGHKTAAAAFATGAHYQKEAHKKLTAEHGDDWHKFTGKEQHRMLQAKYQELQGAASLSSKLSTWKKKILEGKVPSPAEAQAMTDAPMEKSKAVYAEAAAAVGADKVMALQAAALAKVSKEKQAKKPEPAVIVMADPAYGNGGSKVTNVKLGQHTYSRVDGVWKNDSTGQEMGLNKWKAVALNILAGVQFDPAHVDEAYKDMALTAIADLEHGKFSVGQAMGVLYPDLPEGAIKEHDGKTYQLKNGRWHLMDPGAAADPKKNAWDALKGWKGYQAIVHEKAKEWRAENPGKDDELSSALVDLGYLEVAKQMGIYVPPVAYLDASIKVENALNGKLGDAMQNAAIKMHQDPSFFDLNSLEKWKKVRAVAAEQSKGAALTAKEMGKLAFANGISAAPVNDKAFMDAYGNAGAGAMEQWVQGWHEANNASPLNAGMAVSEQPKTKKAPVQVTMVHFTNTTPGHNKFWAVGVHGKQMITSYGKIGTMGQQTIKTFSTELEAVNAAKKLSAEKEFKGGYVKKGASNVTVELDVPDDKPKEPVAPTLTVNGMKLKQIPGGWENENGNQYKSGATVYLAAQTLAGEHEPDIQAYTLTAKNMALGYAIAGGMSPQEALGALFPMNPDHGPHEGDTKIIDGVTYVLKNGRWHKQGDDAAAVLLAASKKNDVKQTAAEKKAAALKAAIGAVQVPDFSGDATSWGPKYAQAAQIIKDSLLAGEGFTKYVLTQQGGAKFLISGIPGLGKMKDIKADSYYVRRKLMFKFLTDLKAAIAANKGGKIAPSVIATTEPAKAAAAPQSAAPSASKPAVVFTQNKSGIAPMDGWTQVGKQQGSNPGGTYKDKNGQEWYVKFPATEDHCKNELLASKLYKAAGVEVPTLRLVSKGGKVGIASKIVPGVTKVGADIKKAPGALEGFAVDAWLGNYDSVGTGYDNLLKTNEGKAIRIDVGGSLLYRAQGAPKGDMFGNEVDEIDGMRDKAKNSYGAAVFSGIGKAKLDESVATVLEIPDDVIEQIVGKFGPGDDAAKKALAAKLIARKSDLAKKFPAADLIANPPKPDPRKLPIDASKLPKLPDFLNWNGQGKGLSGNEKVNAANQKAVQEIHDAAMKGNYVAIKSLKYHVVDKNTGEVKEGAQFGDHPSQHVRDFYSTVIDYMEVVANPAAKKMKAWDVEEYSDIDDLSGAFKAHFYGVSVGSVPANQRLGFWISLGQADAAHAFMPKNVDYPGPAEKSKGSASTKGMPQLLKSWMASVKSSGSANQPYRDGKETDNQGRNCRDVLKHAYDHSVEFPEGTRITKNIDIPTAMMKQMMDLPEGHVFQNPGSMCCSLNKNWTGFAGNARLKIIYAKGAKALYNIGVGSFNGEGEITTIPGQRFMLLKTDKSNHPVEFTVLMLPPDPTYVDNIHLKA